MNEFKNLLTIIGGGSGTGKSTSLRNLGKETVILNTERKELPFASNGITVVNIDSNTKMLSAIDKLGEEKNDHIKVVVVDSFSEWADLLLAECKNKFKGFDVWNAYNTGIFDFFNKLKNLKGKYVIVIGHTEILLDSDGDRIQRIKVKGKENEGTIEKHATCVFFSKTIRKESGKGVDYKFITNTDGELPAKTPMGMFKEEEEFFIDNDVKKIILRYEKFYGRTQSIFAPAAQAVPQLATLPTQQAVQPAV